MCCKIPQEYSLQDTISVPKQVRAGQRLLRALQHVKLALEEHDTRGVEHGISDMAKIFEFKVCYKSVGVRLASATRAWLTGAGTFKKCKHFIRRASMVLQTWRN